MVFEKLRLEKYLVTYFTIYCIYRNRLTIQCLQSGHQVFIFSSQTCQSDAIFVDVFCLGRQRLGGGHKPASGRVNDWRPLGGKAHCSHGQSAAPVCVEFDSANWSTGPHGQLVPTVNWSPQSTVTQSQPTGKAAFAQSVAVLAQSGI